MKKDLSFRVHLNRPAPSPAEAPFEQLSPTTPKERFSENSQDYSLSDTERFEFSTGGNGQPKNEAEALLKIAPSVVQQYIERFDQVAVNEQSKYGIPASIILANALLQSQAGTTVASGVGNNNHFGLSCTDDWQGPTTKVDERCYRQYENAWTSFRDHSLYLTTGRFAHLTRFRRNDYKGWASGMAKTGFSAQENFAEQITQVIERYQLYQFD